MLNFILKNQFSGAFCSYLYFFQNLYLKFYISKKKFKKIYIIQAHSVIFHVYKKTLHEVLNNID